MSNHVFSKCIQFSVLLATLVSVTACNPKGAPKEDEAPLNISAVDRFASYWSVFAGRTGNGDGGDASLAIFAATNPALISQHIAVNSQGDIFIAEPTGIRRIDAATGSISTYLAFGEEANIPGKIGTDPIPRIRAQITTADGGSNMIADGDNLYVMSSPNGAADNSRENAKIYRINTANGTVEYYAGGGTSIDDGISASQAHIYHYTRLAMDSATKDLYFFATCATSFPSSYDDTKANIILRKLTQSDGAAGTVNTVAGTCATEEWPHDGDVATSTGLEQGGHTSMHSLVFVPPGTIYFSIYSNSMNGDDRFYKIIGGKTYRISGSPPYLNSLVYSSSESRLYASAGMLYYMTPNTSTPATETLTKLTLLQAEDASDSGCMADGTALTSACTSGISLFCSSNGPAAGKVAFADGPSMNNDKQYRLRKLVDTGDKLLTFAGGSPLAAEGLQRENMQFGKLLQIHFKSTTAPNQTLFPGGLYFGDVFALQLGYVDLETGTAHVLGGNQIDHPIPAPTSKIQSFDTSAFLGTGYDSSSLGFFTFDPSGLLTFYSSGSSVYRVDQTGKIIGVLTPSGVAPTAFSQATDGATASDLSLKLFGARSSMVYDASGNLYFGNHTATADAKPTFGRVDITNNKYYKVIGGSNITTASAPSPSSPDSSTPGTAQNLDISCTFGATGVYGCPLGAFDIANDRMLFAEGTKVRFVAQPSNPAQSTYGTLGDAGRPVGAFVYEHPRVYYVSDDNKLYCLDLTGANPADCDNTVLGPPSSVIPLSTASLTMDDSGNLYFVSWDGKQIVKFNRPGAAAAIDPATAAATRSSR